MKWFKHDSDAHSDAKLKRLRHKYGIIGYGIYWYCIELIAGNLNKENITFKLEEDAELIALEWSLDQLKVQEIMEFMVDLRLFESNNGHISCMKLAKRLDDTNSKNIEIRSIIKGLELKTNLLEDTPNMSEQTRSEEIRLDKKKIKSKSSPIPYKEIIDLYHKILPQLPKVTFVTDKRKVGIKRLYNYDVQHQNLDWWMDYFVLVSRSNFLMGRTQQNEQHSKWQCNLDFLININKFVKIVEGEYK